jgi:hypothetical protein
MEPKKKNPHAVALGRRGGLVKSERKAAAVRKNGLLGGRRKTPAAVEVVKTTLGVVNIIVWGIVLPMLLMGG